MPPNRLIMNSCKQAYLSISRWSYSSYVSPKHQRLESAEKLASTAFRASVTELVMPPA